MSDPTVDDQSAAAPDLDEADATTPGPGSGNRRRTLVAVVIAVIVVLGTVSYAFGRESRPDDSSRAAAAPTTSTGATSTTPTTRVTTSSTATTSSSTSTSTTTSTTMTTTSVRAPAPSGASNNIYPLAAGAKSQYARSHHDYPAADIFTACGTTFVAPSAGRVDEVSLVDTWSSKVNDGATRGGLSVSVVGDDGVRYYGSHLRLVLPNIRAGSRVALGQPLGQVGDTGSAKGTGCHLHFGLSTPCGPGDWQRRRGQIWPQKYLDAWKVGRQLSAVTETTKSPC